MRNEEEGDTDNYYAADVLEVSKNLVIGDPQKYRCEFRQFSILTITFPLLEPRFERPINALHVLVVCYLNPWRNLAKRGPHLTA